MNRHLAARWTWRAAIGLAILGFGHLCVVQGNDFVAFYDVAEATLQRGELYALGPRAHMHVPYVPYFALVVAPLALLGPAAAAWVWYGLKVAGLALLVRWTRRAVLPGAPDRTRAAAAYVALPFLVAFNPFMSDFRLGQANLLVLLFCALAVRALERRRPLLAAFLFSLAVVKVTALALLPWLVLRRQWRFLASLALVGVGWLAALSAWWGPARLPELFGAWLRSTSAERTAIQRVAYFENQSLQGMAARLAVSCPALTRPVLGLPAYQWLWILPCLALAGLLVASAARDGFRPRLPPEEFALGSLLMLLASSDSRWAHHVQLLVPLAVVTAVAARCRLLESIPGLGPWLDPGAGPAADDPGARRLRLWTGALLLAGLVVLVLLGRDVVGPAVNRAVRAMSFHTAYDLCLVAFLASRLLRRGPETGTPSG